MQRHDRPLTHEWIWQAIDTLATRQGLTPSALARQAGLDPTTFNRSKRLTPEGRPRWPSTESIAKVLEATGTSLDEFASIELGAEGAFAAAPAKGETLVVAGVPVLAVVRDATVAVLDHDRGGGAAADHEAVSLRGRFAITVADSSLEPAYSVGHTLVVKHVAAPRAGDRVVVKPAGLPALPRLLVAATRAWLELGPFGGGDERLAIRRRDIDWVARIVLVHQ
ncbi:MAG: helix-turn-helix transcriptional regulator [Hyphomicrobiaceae bacterium]